jgi:hypothetical protein
VSETRVIRLGDRAPWRWVDLKTGPVLVTDASKGFHFRVPVTENAVLEPPLNATPGQRVIWRLEWAATATVTLSSAFTTRGSVVLPTAAGSIYYLDALYDERAPGTWELRGTPDLSTVYDAAGSAAAAQAASQPLDATLTALAGVNFAADKGVYATAADTLSTYSLTAAGRAIAAVDGIAALRTLIASGVKAVQTTPVTVGGTGTETSLLTGTIVGSLTVPSATVTVGDHYRIRLLGTHGTKATGSGNFICTVYLGATTIGVTASSALADNTPSSSVVEIVLDFVVTAIGAGGTVEATGYVMERPVLRNAGIFSMTNSAAVSVDFSTNKVIDVKWTWGTSDAANTITIRNATVELLRV